jgi:hypothetical protein
MTSWNQLHDDPRISYYRFLRQGYQRPAREAFAKVRRTDAMVVGLQGERRRRTNKAAARLWCRIREFLKGQPEAQHLTARPQSLVWGRRWGDMGPAS